MLTTVAEPQRMTVIEVATELQVDPETVRRWLRVGKLKGANLGGAGGWRIRRVDLEQFIKERER